VIIVSNDGDFDGPVKAARHISLVKSLPELFSEPSGHLGQHQDTLRRSSGSWPAVSHDDPSMLQ